MNVKLSALIAPLLDAKVDHEVIRMMVLAYETDPGALIASLCPPGTRLSYRRWLKVRAKVLDRDGCICNYCGADANTVDHIVPVVRGGSNDPDNLVACCDYCNRSKGAKLLSEWRVRP